MPAGPIETLKSTPGLAAWTAETRRTLRYELYFQAERTESRRRVEDLGGRVTLTTANGARIGRAGFDILAGRPEAFPGQIEAALEQARLGDEAPFPLPGATEYGRLFLLDPLVRDSAPLAPQRVRSAIMAGLARVPGVRLAAAEVFVSKTNIGVVTSAGAAAENDLSDYFVELVLLAGSGAAEQERMATFRRRRFEDLDLEAGVAREARRALDRLEATPPTAGPTPVVLGPEVIGDLVKLLVLSTSGAAVFRQESGLVVGQPVGRAPAGGADPLILEVNALVPFGPASYRIDGYGTAGTNVRVIDDGRFVTPHADAQYAHYLKLAKATGRAGTPTMPPGSKTEADLRSGSYLEVVALSDFIPQRQTGRFSAEIRLGYQVTGGRRRVVTGGTLTGNAFDLVRAARWSKEVALHDEYVGPNAARIESGLTVVT